MKTETQGNDPADTGIMAGDGTDVITAEDSAVELSPLQLSRIRSLAKPGG